MVGQVKKRIVQGVLILNALILLGSFIGSSFLNQQSVAVEESAENKEDQSTGSANSLSLSYEAIVPEFHYYIPLLPALFFVIELTIPNGFHIDLREYYKVHVICERFFGSIICPNAP